MASSTATDIFIPAYHQMMWPTLQALMVMGGSGNIDEINQHVADIAGYSEAQMTALHGKGRTTAIAYRLSWARSYLKSVDALSNSSRGVWTITDFGRTLIEADMASIPTQVRGMLRTKNGAVPASYPEEQSVETVVTVEEAVDDTATILRSTVFEEWRDGLLTVLQAMEPARFERLCQRVLRESGFTKVEVTGRTGDGGIDGTGVMRISLLSFQVLFQCKRYQGNVGSEDIRNFRGAMVGRTDKGLFITTGNFTPSAQREATRDGAPAIDLIDGEQLCVLLKTLKLGVATQPVEEVTIEPEWFSLL